MFTFWLRLTYPRLAAGVGSGNSTVDHACKIGRILGSVTWNAIKSKLRLIQLSYNWCEENFCFDLRILSM